MIIHRLSGTAGRLLRRLVVLGAVFVLAGCATSSIPLTDGSERDFDPRLAGAWIQWIEADGERRLVLVIENFGFGRVDGKLGGVGLTIMHFTESDMPCVVVEEQRVITATLGGNDYLSRTTKDGDWLIAAYSFDGHDTLLLRGMSADIVARAIKSGEIAGSDLRLMATPETLRAFVVGNHDALFGASAPDRLERLRRPRARE